jgi:hygromycin-B 7''-O-kinase
LKESRSRSRNVANAPRSRRGRAPSTTLLPVLTADADYKYWHAQIEPWLPGVRRICQNHGLATDRLERIAEGRSIVFRSGNAVLKLLPAFLTWHLEQEQAALVKVHGCLPLRTPEVLAAGQLEGWAYLIMSWLPGTMPRKVWPALEAPDQHRLMRRLGEEIQALQRVDASDMPRNWHALVQKRCEEFAEVQRLQELPEEVIPSFAEALERAVPHLPANPPMVLLHSDMGHENLLLEEVAGRWELTGLVDFGGVLTGCGLYDMGVPCITLTAHRPELRRALLAGYGAEMTEDQLLAVLLLDDGPLSVMMKHHRVAFTPEAFRDCYCRL